MGKVKKVEYGNLLSKKWDIVTITNDLGQQWELKRNGVSSAYVQGYLSVMGKTEGILSLIEKEFLIPLYGGDMNIGNTDKKTDGTIFFDELVAFHENERKIEEARKEIRVLEEQKKALECQIKELVNIAYNDKEAYKFSGPVLEIHKFWSNEDFTYIAKIDEIISPGYVKYTVCERGNIDAKHSSSSLGILCRHPLAITEERYYELREKLIPDTGE